MNNKRGQIGQTITWTAGFIVLFFCSMLFLASIVGIKSKREASVNYPVVFTYDKIYSQRMMQKFYTGQLEIGGENISVSDALDSLENGKYSIKGTKENTDMSLMLSYHILNLTSKTIPKPSCSFVTFAKFEKRDLSKHKEIYPSGTYAPVSYSQMEESAFYQMKLKKGQEFYRINSSEDYEKALFFFGGCE